MSGTFETGSSSIDLSGSPWNVKDVIRVYVRNLDGDVGLFKDAACDEPFIPPRLEVPYDRSTGLYFYIAAGSTAGTLFCDGLDGRPLPVSWLQTDLCPSTVTYGKILASRKAFSMQDLADHASDVTYPFDLMIQLPDGRHIRVAPMVKVDPTIVEKGQEPSGGGGGRKS